MFFVGLLSPFMEMPAVPRPPGMRSAVLLSALFLLPTEPTGALAQEIHQEEVQPPEPRPASILPEGFEWIRAEGGGDRLFDRINPFRLPARVVTSLTVEGEYNDNVFERQQDRDGDFLMRITPGVALNLVSPRAFLNLGYSTSATLYYQFHELNDVTGHRLAAAAGVRPSRDLSIGVTDSFVRSNEIGERLGLTQPAGRETFTRNSVTPQVEYTFSRELSTVLRYNNTTVFNEAVNQDDSYINSARGNLRYTYGPGRFFEAGYEQTWAKFSISPDFTGYEYDATLTHAFDRLTTVTLASTYFIEDRRGGASDRVLSRTTLGVVHRLTPRLTGSLSAGVGIFDDKGREEDVRPDVRFSLAWASPFFSATASYDFFFDQTFSEAENVGTTLTHRTGITLRYLFTPELLGRVGATYSRVELLESTSVAGSVEGRVDDVVSANTDMSYRLLRWLFLTVGYNLFKRESNQPGFDLLINRFRISLTTEYSL